MRIEEMPPVMHDWPEHARLTEADSIETVRVVREPPYIDVPRKVEKNVDDGARLDTYQSRRLRTIQDLTEDLEQALVRANQAKDGAASVGYFPIFLSKIDEMIAAGNEARDLIAMFEEDH